MPTTRPLASPKAVDAWVNRTAADIMRLRGLNPSAAFKLARNLWNRRFYGRSVAITRRLKSDVQAEQRDRPTPAPRAPSTQSTDDFPEAWLQRQQAQKPKPLTKPKEWAKDTGAGSARRTKILRARMPTESEMEARARTLAQAKKPKTQGDANH